MSQKPYITRVIEVLSYNPEYGDDKICECGHTYERHFDSYEDMSPVGCKHCSCYEFVENTGKSEELVEKILEELNTISSNWTLYNKSNSNLIRFSNKDGFYMDYYSYNDKVSYMFSHLHFIVNTMSLVGNSNESILAAYNDLKDAVQKCQSEITEYLTKL